VFGFEAFEQWDESKGVENQVEYVLMEERICVQAVYCISLAMHSVNFRTSLTCLKIDLLRDQSTPLRQTRRKEMRDVESGK